MDTDVMRQAVTKLILGLCVVLAPPVWGDGGPAADEAPIARARRLIREGQRAAAVTLLEDTLAECPAADRPALLVLLRQSYEAMAREAEAAGRADDAAQYRENLSILDRAREAAPLAAKSTAPPRPQPTKPRTAHEATSQAHPGAGPEEGRDARLAGPRGDPARTGGGHAARVVGPARLAGPEARPGPAGTDAPARARRTADARANAAGLVAGAGDGDVPRAPLQRADRRGAGRDA